MKAILNSRDVKIKLITHILELVFFARHGGYINSFFFQKKVSERARERYIHTVLYIQSNNTMLKGAEVEFPPVNTMASQHATRLKFRLVFGLT